MANAVANQPNYEDMDPAMRLMEEQNAKLKEWFAKHPKEEDAVALPMEEKKEFIMLHYFEDTNADEQLEKMLEEAEKILDAEIKLGHNKAPFTPELVLSTIAIAKAKIMDDLVEEVGKFYAERRKMIKGKEITDPGVIKVTQLNCSKMATSLQEKLAKQIEEEATSRNFPMGEFMDQIAMILMSDMQVFVEIEKVYAFRKGEEKRDQAIDREKVKQYIEESIKIAQQINEGVIDSSIVFVYPHLLSDKLFNLIGFESEEIVIYIRKMTKEDKMDEELSNLIIKEAYEVEKSKESCQNNFNEQMMGYEKQMMEAYEHRSKELANMKDPLEDPAIKKMIEMGMISKEQAQQMISEGGPGMGGPGMGGPGMGGPGMGFPGIGGPGMEGMPPGMMPSPEMMMQMMQMMPPGMFDPSMMGGMPPGMFGGPGQN